MLDYKPNSEHCDFFTQAYGFKKTYAMEYKGHIENCFYILVAGTSWQLVKLFES